MQTTHLKDSKVNVLFVCLGNICRSPAAEGIFKKLVEQNGLENVIHIDSAGTSGWHEGDLPDERMRLHGEQRGYNFNSRARKFIAQDFKRFDYIIVMDDENYKNATRLASDNSDLERLHRMTDFSNKYDHSFIPDPYYGGPEGFELVMDLLEDACENLLEEIKKKYNL